MLPDDNPIQCYWLDTCPVCGKPCTVADRSAFNPQRRWCDDGHCWLRNDDGSYTLKPESNHVFKHGDSA